MYYPEYRPRRLRKTEVLREMVRETELSPRDFIFRSSRSARFVGDRSGECSVMTLVRFQIFQFIQQQRLRLHSPDAEVGVPRQAAIWISVQRDILHLTLEAMQKAVA